MTAFFNTGLSQQQFLEEYWQKKTAPYPTSTA
jgi:ribosomal protein L16 Arg81 hydroxylase